MRKITKQSFFFCGIKDSKVCGWIGGGPTGGHVYGSKCLTPFFWDDNILKLSLLWALWHSMFDLCPPELHVIEDNRVCCTGAGSSICRARASQGLKTPGAASWMGHICNLNMIGLLQLCCFCFTFNILIQHWSTICQNESK